jgi:hypothetical protein
MCYSLPAFLIATTLVASGCGKPQVSLQERVLPHANPTSYEFDDATINDVKSAIKKAFEKWRDEELKNRKERIWKGSGDADAKTPPHNATPIATSEFDLEGRRRCTL